MVLNHSAKQNRHAFSAVACVVAFVIGSGIYAGAVVAETPATSIPQVAGAGLPVDLEQAFWACDYIATTRGVHAAPVELCSVVTDELKHQKFGGDFLELLDWWGQNKLLKHAQIASSH